ncbi:peptidase M24, structural domain-containing protein [Lipomyces oligophaga]|uniref:peptidase M24, structural domain-containing protein n=1 Tax=Lipomyces oligophaga TaxID=45792 RepID=UPI0034CECD00
MATNKSQEMTVDSQRSAADVNKIQTFDSPATTKYCAAGKIAQSVLKHLVGEIANNKISNAYEICRTGDEMIEREAKKIFKTVDEKGVAMPTTIDVNNCIVGYSPVDSESGYVLHDGDVVKISLGAHIDGFTALASHTLVVYPSLAPADQVSPTPGLVADAICASYMATEAVIKLLGTVLDRPDPSTGALRSGSALVTGESIKQVVEIIAKTYKVKIVPGSQVRRIKRFLVGQDAALEVDVKGYAWGSLRIAEATDDPDEGDLRKDIDSTVPVEAGEAWIVDISMCEFAGKDKDLNPHNSLQLSRRAIKEHRSLRPTIFTRDYSTHIEMRVKAARGVLTEIDMRKSVFPFHSSALQTDGAPLGIAALTSAGVLAPSQVWTAPSSSLVTRERTTILLVPNKGAKNGGEIVRLTGGEITPSWVHSEFEITDALVKGLLDANVRIRNVVGVSLEGISASDEMDIE